MADKFKFTMDTTNAQLAAHNASQQPKKKGSGKVRYVRTAAGQKRYGRSIGDVIVAGKKLENVKHENPVYPGWDLIKGKNGVKYDVGKMQGKFVAYVHNSQDGKAIEADSHAELLEMLNDRVTKVKQTVKPRYDREGRQKQTAPDGTPLEPEQAAVGRGRAGGSSARGSRGASPATTKPKPKKKLPEGEYEGSSLTGVRQLTALALGTGGTDTVKNRKYADALMRILKAQGLVQEAKPDPSKPVKRDPLGSRNGKSSTSTRKWEPVEGVTASQIARSIRYDEAIDRILFQWDEDRRNSKG